MLIMIAALGVVTLVFGSKNGQLLDVEVTVSHLEMDGRQTLCYIAHDITERKNIDADPDRLM